MNLSTFEDSEKFLLNLKVGEGFGHENSRVTVIKKTKKSIYLSDKKIIHIKKVNNFFYLDAKGNSIKQILRDIEGFLIYKIHAKNNINYGH